MKTKGNRKNYTPKRKSKETLEFSISQRVDGLMMAREAQKGATIKKDKKIKSPLERSTRRGRCVEVGEQKDTKNTPPSLRTPENTISFQNDLPCPENGLKIELKSKQGAEIKNLIKGVAKAYVGMMTKATALFLIVAINWVTLSSVGNTISYFNDTEESKDNYIAATNLNFDLHSQENFSPVLTPSISAEREIIVQNDGGMAMGYDGSIEFKDKGEILCDELDLKMKMNGLTIYEGSLVGFSLSDLNMNSQENDSFSFEVYLDNYSDIFWSKKCSFDFIFTGNQEEVSGYSDKEIISNTVLSGTWEIPDEIKKGDVVINEIMWMKSLGDGNKKKGGDIWIELRNMTDHKINIGKWHIEGIRKKGKDYMIPASRKIPAHGYFLVSSHPNTSANSNLAVEVNQVNSSLEYKFDYEENGQIVLRDRDEKTIDETPAPESGDWPAGVNEDKKKWSMERNLYPGEGAELGSWHTCNPDLMTTAELETMQSYWKENARLYSCGTPGNINLSDNDPNYREHKSASSKKVVEESFEEDESSAKDNTTKEEKTEEDSEEEKLAEELSAEEPAEELLNNREEIDEEENQEPLAQAENEGPEEDEAEESEKEKSNKEPEADQTEELTTEGSTEEPADNQGTRDEEGGSREILSQAEDEEPEIDQAEDPTKENLVEELEAEQEEEIISEKSTEEVADNQEMAEGEDAENQETLTQIEDEKSEEEPAEEEPEQTKAKDKEDEEEKEVVKEEPAVTETTP